MRSFKGKIGLLTIIFVTSFPLVVWVFSAPLSPRFGDLFSILSSLGQLTAIVGTTLFSLALLLSARLWFLEEYFGGLDRMYNVHHTIGTLALLFLLVHPLLLAFRYAPTSLYLTATYLLPSGDWPKNLGIIALVILMGLLGVTFYAKWRYQIRKFLHQILGIVFFIGALHAFLISGALSTMSLLKWSLMCFAILALSAYLYRTIFGRMTVSRYTYKVHAVHQLDETVTEVVMHSEGARMQYLPGQFLFVRFKHGGIERETHPFSISSAPSEPVLRITAKALGDFTKELRNLQVGATALVEGPFGSFTYLYGTNRNQIWIAGGIGITPFLNMARNLRMNPQSGHSIDFYYSTKTAEEMIFLKELTEIAQVYPGLRVIPYNADQYGFLTMDAVQKLSSEIMGKDIYVCGPPPMMHSLIAQCQAKGVPKHLIHSEEFKLL